MDANILIASLRRRREKSVVVGEIPATESQPARVQKVFFSRPPETDLGSMLKSVEEKDGTTRTTWMVTLDHVKKYTTGWEGFTEADFQGATVGSSDPVPFSAELFAVVVEDDTAMTRKITEAIIDAVVEHINKKSAVSGN